VKKLLIFYIIVEASPKWFQEKKKQEK